MSKDYSLFLQWRSRAPVYRHLQSERGTALRDQVPRVVHGLTLCARHLAGLPSPPQSHGGRLSRLQHHSLLGKCSLIKYHKWFMASHFVNYLLTLSLQVTLIFLQLQKKFPWPIALLKTPNIGVCLDCRWNQRDDRRCLCYISRVALVLVYSRLFDGHHTVCSSPSLYGIVQYSTVLYDAVLLGASVDSLYCNTFSLFL